ncbi:MAG TPA: hypothetical protein VJB87_00545 [Candidatus Nanoarchaeia archaeon]|nr:hypothetical protein [Candidatus Nanoarchaeia archaeon]
MPRPTIVIDFDDCTVMSSIPFMEWCQVKGFVPTGTIDDLVHHVFIATDHAIRRARYFQFLEERNNELQPLPGVVSAIAELAQHFSVHIGTARQISLRGHTETWVRRNLNGHVQEIHFAQGTGLEYLRDKTPLLQTLQARALVDDGEHHAQRAAEVGILSVMPIYPWNRKCAFTSPYLIRVSDRKQPFWHTILPLVTTVAYRNT